MVAQRRYSVTGQTPPDVAETLKARSPKLQALDTGVQSTSCGLCDGGAESNDLARGRTGIMAPTASKRSATQLPSPSSPGHELPPKIARYRSALHDEMAMDTDPDTDVDSDITDDLILESQATSLASTPEHPHLSAAYSLPDTECLEKLQLCTRTEQLDSHHMEKDDDDDDDACMEDLALSPPHSRNHSLDCAHFYKQYAIQQKWLQAYTVPFSQAVHIEDIAQAAPSTPSYIAPTFLTLPPEIRHQIYRNCDELVFRQPLLYCIATAFDKIQHPLASVSRQVRSEVLAIFYSYNTWTIKVEFKMMYEGFQHWIIRLGDGASYLRLLDFSVRGTLFKPKRTHMQSVLLHGQLIQITPGVATNGREELYSPPDGDASFKIDLSEKYFGGKVQLVRNDGTSEAGEKARQFLEKMVHGLWEKRRSGVLNGQDWVTMVDQFISFVGGW